VLAARAVWREPSSPFQLTRPAAGPVFDRSPRPGDAPLRGYVPTREPLPRTGPGAL